MAHQAGFDAIFVDLEHSTIGLDAASGLCALARSIGLVALVRVPVLQHQLATRLLDGGADGVVYPRVSSVDEARAIVEACRFPPLGHRSVVGRGLNNFYADVNLDEANRHGNAATACIAMVETLEGVAEATAIASTEGIDALLVGASDLSSELGVPGQTGHPKVVAAIDEVARACQEHGTYLGVGGVAEGEQLARLTEAGARLFVPGADHGFLMAALQGAADRMRPAVRTCHPDDPAE